MLSRTLAAIGIPSAHVGTVLDDALEFLDRAEAIRHLARHLVMDVEHDGIAGRLEPHQRRGEQIAGDRLRDVLGPKPGQAP